MISHHVLILLALCFYQNSFASLPPYKRLAEQSDKAPQTKKQKIMTPLNDAQKMLCEGLSQDDGFNLIKKALELGANPNLALENKTTPLTIAAHKLRLDIVKELIDKGARVNEKNGWGQTPLIESIKKHINSEPFALFLLEKGADVNLADRFGTPLLFAISNSCTLLAKELICRGAEVNSNHEKETSLLAQAIASNKNNSHDEIIELILKKGAIVDVQPKQKGTVTPISAAISHGNNALSKQFIKKKQVSVSIDLLEVAFVSGNEEMAHIILNELNYLDNRNKTITRLNEELVRFTQHLNQTAADETEKIVAQAYKIKQMIRAKELSSLELE
ncbi:hypothetical protein Noda2021_06160 [Candidatus Dependentiae bacterium Noda2021]|nr:hypothetical protein Noda2021_06160 [Candidatus Dependentiae bacterium Noda2021]